MTPRVVPFCSWHVAWLEKHGLSEKYGLLSPEVLADLQGSAITVVLDDMPLACGGALEYWPGRSQLWAFLNAEHSPKHMMAITHAARALIRPLKGRIEFTVRRDFDAGHRWARALRFDVETPLLSSFGINGEDHTGYVRIQ